MPVIDTLLRMITARCERVRSGLDVGFGDAEVSRRLREARGGVWMSIGRDREFPFEDCQFEVVVMDGSMVSREIIREANRVLRPDGCLFFVVPEKTRKQDGFMPPEIYRIVREGFNILAVDGPAWWTFGFGERTLAVCARKKAWHEHRPVFGEGSVGLAGFGGLK